METSELRSTIDELRSTIDEVRQNVAILSSTAAAVPAPVDTRSAGQVLKDILAKRDTKAAFVTRTFDGAKLEDVPEKPSWIRDLTRFYLAPSVLAQIFKPTPLPSEGMSVEFTRIKTNTFNVSERTEEGATIPTGKLTFENFTKPIHMFAGGGQISIEMIERAPIPALDRSLTALSIEAGRHRAAHLESVFSAALKERKSAALEVAGAVSEWKAANIRDMLIDAAEAANEVGRPARWLVVNKETFKRLANLEDKNGRSLMPTLGDGVNSVGTMDLAAPSGKIFHLSVLPSFKLGAIDDTKIIGGLVAETAFERSEAPLVSLQGTNVLNLTKDFGVYGWGAAALIDEASLVPVKAGA